MFQDLIGNEKVKNILEKTINDGNVLHSYLFIGIEGIGKSLFAKEFASNVLGINCDLENNPDFMIVNPEGNSIKIEQIRFLIQKIYEKPVSSSRKVYIINDSEKMTIEAQNSLLKTLEEPPSYATLILTTSNESRLLGTIISRCTKIYFSPIEENEILKYVIENNLKDVSKSIISACQGSVRKINRV